MGSEMCIRDSSSGEFDGVIDFDAVVRDPSEPKRILPSYTEDNLHPNDTGYIDTLSEIFYVQGNTQNAIENIKKAIQLDPDDAYYKQQLWKFKNVELKPIS